MHRSCRHGRAAQTRTEVRRARGSSEDAKWSNEVCHSSFDATSAQNANEPRGSKLVPEATWKVAVFVDAGESPLAASDPYVVAVLPNVRSIEEVRWTYRTTVAEIERASGYGLPSLQ